jgi:fibronectin-binding autotransporter adhesin
MADRYWVGGSGSWSSTAKWSATSGGASGASVPTASDNAIFDANSGAAHYTVTVTDNATCADLTFTPHASDGVTQFAVGNGFVIAGTFSTSGTQGNRRAWFRSSTESLMRDVSIAVIGTVTDVDFRDIRITGAGGTLTGTRIGDLRGNVGITLSTPKNCFRIGTGNWSDDQWSDTSGSSPNTDFFPLAQDTAVFDESTTGGTHTMNTAITYTGAVDMSARTSALTLSLSTGPIIYGDWTFGSGITISGAQTMSFTGRNTQVITSAGKTFSGGITVESYGGTVELADALNMGSQILTVGNGTFDTKGYNVTAGTLSSTNSNVREIRLGASTVTLSGNVFFGTSTNLTFDASTSSIVFTTASATIDGGNQTFYGVSFTSTGAGTHTANQSNTFNSLSITAPASANLRQVAFSGDQTITGTLTAAGATAVRRVMLRSSVVGTTRTLTVGTLSADDCDFRDITIAGTAAGGSPTRAGDCGGNSGVTFPAPKTVYWNLAGSQNWSADGWATTSGGVPATNNFPLAQDTAVFDDTGSAGTVTVNGSFNIGTLDMSARTTAMTLQGNTAYSVYGNWTFGSGITHSGTATVTFSGRGTSTITSAGKTFSGGITIDCGPSTVQLADALELNTARTLTLTTGTFDAVSYNVTAGRHSYSASNTTLKMGSGTFTASGTGGVWTASGGLTFYKGTADILLSNTTTTARTFQGSSLSYNKLTIGGATGTSTLTISDNNQFTELASTKTVAHTIALGTTTQTFGKWSVTGTSGNVVTLTGTGTSHILAGSCTSGIDYLAIGSIRFAATSPAEFYAGANSTATGSPAAPTYLTDKPADSTRYWVGGTGNWNDTTYWSTSSGGASGADLPRSHDDVVFDSSSNATDYTATVNAITGGNRCKALTIAGPASGNVTLAGSTALFIHDDITLPATGLTRTYTGQITLSGTGVGKTITTNGVALANAVTVNGVSAEWALADALNTGNSTINIINGSFDTDTYNLTTGLILSDVANSRTIDFGSSTVSLAATGVVLGFGTTETKRANLTFTAGTFQINVSSASPTFTGNNQTFYNISFTSTSINTAAINGSNTFNNLTVAGRTSASVAQIALSADQTINGTLTLSAGTNATMRTFVRSDTIGTTRTLTCAAVAALTDIDFRDITIAGAAAPVSGTRLGDCKGNTGITFDAGVNKYWNFAGGGNWSSTAWATSSGGAVSNDNFPLAQDTCLFEATGLNSGNTATLNAAYNIGTIDMSARTTNTMTLATGSQTPSIYGNWTNGTGVTFSGTGTLTFAGRGSHTITSAGRTFTQAFTIDTPGGSVTLQDAFETNRSSATALTLNAGTFDANSYNVTLSDGAFSSANTNTRTVAIGSETWTVARSSTAWNTSNATNLTITGTGTISFTSASAKTFAVGTADYSSITANQGGAGTLTINSIGSLANITNTYSATGATTLNFGTTTQRVANFTATGTAGNVLTIQGTSATSPCTLIYTGTGAATAANTDYLTLTGVRAYPLADTWYAGDNSTNNGSLGWSFTATPVVVTSTGNFFMLFG